MNGVEVKVRLNLFSFLAEFRKFPNRSDFWLWIDFLCIDQGRVEERNHQVGLMHRIFPTADHTFVWLGPDEHNGKAFRLLEDFVSKVKSLEKAYPDKGTEYQANLVLMEKPERNAAWHEPSIRSLLGNIYWTRHWIAQEVALSAKVAVFYGSFYLPWPQLQCFIEAHWKIGYGWSPLDPLAILIPLYHYAGKDTSSDEAHELSLASCMMFARYSRCQDAVDKIYGIQSLLHPELRIEVDYTLSKEAVFMEAVATYMGSSLVASSESLPQHCFWLAEGMGLEFERAAFERGWCHLADTRESRSADHTKDLGLDLLEVHVLGPIRQSLHCKGSRTNKMRTDPV